MSLADRILESLIADAVERGEMAPRPEGVTPYQWWISSLYADEQDMYVNEWIGAGIP